MIVIKCCAMGEAQGACAGSKLLCTGWGLYAALRHCKLGLCRERQVTLVLEQIAGNLTWLGVAGLPIHAQLLTAQLCSAFCTLTS